MAINHTPKDLFNFMLGRVKDVAIERGIREPQAFARWFINLYAFDPQNIVVCDGPKDGKVDAFYCTTDGNAVCRHVVNSKFTGEYGKQAPASFYEEVTYLFEVFENKKSRPGYLQKVKGEFRDDYKRLFSSYDEGKADVTFLTNCRRHDMYADPLEAKGIQFVHCEDLVQYMIDDIDGAMPRTKSLLLSGIQHVLSPGVDEAAVPTSIVFARLVDFIDYMADDPFELLFARNVRLFLGERGVNKLIKETFRDRPEEFVFSNNGITLICESLKHDPGVHELKLENPRVVNGSQTLHSVRSVESPSKKARVMVRIITIQRFAGKEVSAKAERRKEIVNKVAIRSNQQNPIKPWNLIANDDFQLELFRYFRKKNLFYQRRENEWNFRSRHLKSAGFSKGPELKWLMQLVASGGYESKKLGPAVAKASTSSLFDGAAYDLLRETSPEAAYQLYLLGELLYEAYPDGVQKYVNVKKFWNLCLFARLCRIVQSAAQSWKPAEVTEALEGWWAARSEWSKAVKGLVQQVMEFYKKRAHAYEKAEDYELSALNYAKNASYIQPLLSASIPSDVRRWVSKALNKARSE